MSAAVSFLKGSLSDFTIQYLIPATKATERITIIGIATNHATSGLNHIEGTVSARFEELGTILESMFV